MRAVLDPLDAVDAVLGVLLARLDGGRVAQRVQRAAPEEARVVHVRDVVAARDGEVQRAGAVRDLLHARGAELRERGQRGRARRRAEPRQVVRREREDVGVGARDVREGAAWCAVRERGVCAGRLGRT